MGPHYACRWDDIIKMAHRISFVFRDTWEFDIIWDLNNDQNHVKPKQLLDAKPLY